MNSNKATLTSDEHQARREAIVSKVKELNPEAEFNIGKYSMELVYYSASVVASKVKVTKVMKLIYSYPERSIDDLARLMTLDKHLTKQAAIDAIKTVLPKAQAHFEHCQSELKALQNKLNFFHGYSYDGDTHGIYNEYDYISFKLDGFYFEFATDSSLDDRF